MGKLGKKRLPIIINPAYCKILFCLIGGSKNHKSRLEKGLKPQNIANEISLDQSTTIKHLKILRELGYVKVKMVKKTKFYIVDFEKIQKAIIVLIGKIISERLEEINEPKLKKLNQKIGKAISHDQGFINLLKAYIFAYYDEGLYKKMNQGRGITFRTFSLGLIFSVAYYLDEIKHFFKKSDLTAVIFFHELCRVASQPLANLIIPKLHKSQQV